MPFSFAPAIRAFVPPGCHKPSWQHWLVACLAVICIADADAKLAQVPLLTAAAQVRPNILLLMDTSGSMAWGCVYSPRVTAALNVDNANRMSKGIPSGVPGLTIGCLDTRTAWDTRGRNLYFEPLALDPRHLSPSNNLLYYDPSKTYEPGYLGGIKQPNAAVSRGLVIFLPNSAAATATTSADLSNIAYYVKYEIAESGFYLNDRRVSSNPLGARQRKDCAAVVCTLQEEMQNIANWRAYHSTRMLAAKTGLSAALLSQIDNFRLAWGDIYITPTPAAWGKSQTSLTMMENYASARGKFFDWLDRREPGGGTSLVGALQRAGEYYENTSAASPWASSPSARGNEKVESFLACRRSHTLMITDGFWNGYAANVGNADGNSQSTIISRDGKRTFTYDPSGKAAGSIGKPDGFSNTLADVALKYWANDLQPGMSNITAGGSSSDFPFWQNMTSHMVSFGAPGSMSDEAVALAKAGDQAWPEAVADTLTTIDDMRHAAHNGGGEFLTVNDAEQFANDLGKLIGSIAGQASSSAGVAGSEQKFSSTTRKAVPVYVPDSWWGNIAFFSLKGDGAVDRKLWEVIATDDKGQPTGATTLRAPGERPIFVWVDAVQKGVVFNYPSLNRASLIGNKATTQMPPTVTADMIDYLRGNRSLEGKTFRKRAAVLGNVVNSRPVFVKNTTDPQFEKLLAADASAKEAYLKYMRSKAARTEGAYFVGANDGMLHVFAEGTASTTGGRELMAYVPRSVLGKLPQLASADYQHTYTVDGPLAETDAFVSIGGQSAAWKNLVVGTSGAGAKALFALDASDLSKLGGNSILWEFNADKDFPVLPDNTADSFSELGHVLAPVQSGVTAGGQWISVFGNGYDSASGKASLFIVETATGRLIKRIDTDEQTSNGLSAVRLVLDDNRQILGAYAGDLRGRLWKFDLSGKDPLLWSLGNGGQALFTAANGNKPLPITAPPEVFKRTDVAEYPGSYIVMVGTGKLTENGDAQITSPTQMAYGLWDRAGFGAAAMKGKGEVIKDDDLEPVKAEVLTQGVAAGVNDSLNTGDDTVYRVKYSDASVARIDWSKRRGWKLPLDLRAGLRVIQGVNLFGSVVKIDALAPLPEVPSCEASTTPGVTLILNPLSGVCRAGGTIDINKDGKINANDAAACGYATFSAGPDAVMPYASSKGLFMAQTGGAGTGAGSSAGNPGDPARDPNGGGSKGFRGADDATCADPAYAAAHPGAAIACRSWRQIYLRGR